MKSKIANKLIAICLIFTFIFSLINPAIAELIQSNEDGVAYDLFDNADSITLSENCTIENGTVLLEEKSYSLVYDYKNKPDNFEGWEHDDPFFVPGGEFGKILSSITNPTLLAKYKFNNDDLSKIEAKDDNNLNTNSIAVVSINYVYHPLQLFKIQINERVDQLLNSNFQVGWWTGNYNPNYNLDEIRMYLWSYGDLLPRWNFIGSLNYTEDDVNSSSGFIYTEESVNKFFSDDGEIYILLVGKPKENIDPIEPAVLSTDYIKVEIPIEKGFKIDGHIISEEITPDTNKFKGWEQIIWEGSIPTDDTYIKIQVLDSAGNKFPDTILDGNSNGFLESPVDISSLGTSVSSIRLKAIFHTDLYSITPRLFSWGVLWHTKDGFFDSFTNDFRVGDKSGVEIENGDVEISKFFTEWPIFGKNPANTRSYSGRDVEINLNDTYWQTEINNNIGGWFKSPILSDDRVFISDNRSRILAFNLTHDDLYGKKNVYKPRDISEEGFEVETAVAADNGYLVVATSELNSNKNKIYALNTTQLTDIKWEYPAGKDNNFIDSICFSAAPTISNRKVYVTSWSGQYANHTIFNYLFSKIDPIFNYALGTNNKLFILDLTSGNEIIKPIRLPAASLSTPAIDNGLIFVGCENYGGPSLFAYDESTGKMVWNVSVGTIGRSSPVVVEGENGKIVIIVARNQSIFSLKGEDKVVALDAETGEILWDFTIGNESTWFTKAWLQTYQFNHIKAIEPPAATPSFYNSTVYVMASDGIIYAIDVNTGEEKWKFATFSSIVSEYHSSSPIVFNGTVYVISQDATLFALDADSGKIKDQKLIEYDNYILTSYAYSSPIITDGLIIISFFDWRFRDGNNTYFGHLIAYGGLEKNKKGMIYSNPIHIEKGKWWNKFNAQYETSIGNSTITFKILDGDGNVILDGLNGTNNNISTHDNINTNVIQLCAELEILKDKANSPILYSWGVNWTEETNPPQFIESSFKPDPTGWIRNNTPVFSINVRDAFPGLNTEEAYYRITYVNNQKSDWIQAKCSGKMGSRNTESITADLSKLSNVTDDLKSIEFKIKDLSENPANFKLDADFRIDKEKPVSQIENEIASIYNTPVNIDVTAVDPTNLDDNSSGIDTIAIYYRMHGDNNWILYDQEKNIFNWLFSPPNSGEIEICTIAKDVAGNVEDFPDFPEASFIYDATEPEIPDFKTYIFNWIPKFSIQFEDDYKLKTVEYRIEFSANWTKINNQDINAKTYNATWNLEDEWPMLMDNVTYNLYFRLTDFAGNQNETQVFDALKFLIDTIPPGVKITLDLSDFEKIGKEKYLVSATIPDDDQIANVTLHYSYSSDGSDYSRFKQYGEDLVTPPYQWNFKPDKGNGYYRFSVRVWDEAGNYNSSPIKEVNLTEVPLIAIILIIILFIFFIFISFTILKKIRTAKG